MDPREEERPCIHVALLEGVEPALYRWVQIGAEEEGVPCRLVVANGADPVAAAYDAAMSSRFGIGAAVAGANAVLHERHMPPAGPVMALALNGRAAQTCRMLGANAARMVIRKPLRFPEDERETPQRPAKAHASWRRPSVAQPPETVIPAAVDAALIARIVARVVMKLQERGIQ